MSSRDGAPNGANKANKRDPSGSSAGPTGGPENAIPSLLGAQSPSRLPEGEELEIWLSAFADGELPEPHTTLLTEALEQDPALLDRLELIAASAQTALSASESAALTDDILAATAPTALGTAAADRLASAAFDDALDQAGLDHLQQLAADVGAAQQVADFLDTTDAVRAQVEAGVAHPALNALLAPMADLVDDVVTDDARAFVLSQMALDGCLNDAERDELVDLLHDSPAHRTFREAGLSASAAVSEAAQVALAYVSTSPDAARAGAAALQAIAAEQAQAEAALAQQQAKGSVPAVRDHEAGLIGWLADRFRYLAPVAFAGAAAAVFFAVSDPLSLDAPGHAIEAPVDAILHTLEQDLEDELEEQKVALNEDLALIDDNHSEVLSIDTGTRATLVYETEASNITVIWVSDPADADDAASATDEGADDEADRTDDEGNETEGLEPDDVKIRETKTL